ncbi:Flp pilus assembly protein TadB [Catenuloplanes nepalensis]|uniref:Flp pilus assembly protein TadB n=1 Tax=Catenuloplanes nepalensis TaxID=587533 RepID=A0ABT9N2I8_9ACTN|nr:Flp pilus assembly protein TadB [Catenuloplanes nepalensis]
MPTSVLLAVLAAAGLLALAPALVRRYDATERQVAERAQSTARVLERRRRRRTVPGRRPINPPRHMMPPDSTTSVPSSPDRAGLSSSAKAESSTPASGPPGSRASGGRGGSGGPGSGGPGSGGLGGSGSGGRRGRRRSLRLVPDGARRARRRPARRRRQATAVTRRRRVLAALVLLNGVQLLGVAVVGPGFWISVSVTGTLLVAYVVHLRNRAIAERRRRRQEAREAAWLARRQAEVRREQKRRAEARKADRLRLAAQREAVRRAAMGLDRGPDVDLPAAADGTAGPPPPPAKPRGGSVSYRSPGLRGRPYQAGGGPGQLHRPDSA